MSRVVNVSANEFIPGNNFVLYSAQSNEHFISRPVNVISLCQHPRKMSSESLFHRVNISQIA